MPRAVVARHHHERVAERAGLIDSPEPDSCGDRKSGVVGLAFMSHERTEPRENDVHYCQRGLPFTSSGADRSSFGNARSSWAVRLYVSNQNKRTVSRTSILGTWQPWVAAQPNTTISLQPRNELCGFSRETEQAVAQPKPQPRGQNDTHQANLLALLR
jgi:hypothetical protein